MNVSVAIGGELGAMEKEKIARINFLAKKSRSAGLTEEEKLEQQSLRNEYREFMRRGYMSELDKVYIIDENGSKKKLIKD